MSEHSKRFELVKAYYDKGQWSKAAVRNAVGRWITEGEYAEIVGESPKEDWYSWRTQS